LKLFIAVQNVVSANMVVVYVLIVWFGQNVVLRWSETLIMPDWLSIEVGIARIWHGGESRPIYGGGWMRIQGVKSEDQCGILYWVLH